MILFRLGDRTGAERHLSEALRINPIFSFLHRDVAERTLERVRRES
jgi:hypothetical protein